MSKQKRQDIIVLLSLIPVAALASLAIHADFLFSTILFFGLPAAYLLTRAKVKNTQAFVSVILFGIIYGVLVEYLAELNNAWKIDTAFFTSRIWGLVSIDAVIWTSLLVLLFVLFYEHFTDHDRKDRLSKNVWIPIVFAAFLFFLCLFQQVIPLQVSHAYLFFGLMSLLPCIYVLWKRPALLPKLTAPILYFFPLALTYELIGRTLGQWEFPGQYIGSIQVIGITFPLEEFFFWIVANSFIVAAMYELFIDDMK